ncbi:sensor histidine kinase [Okeania hirsuta]|nr:hypothetical protein [Okeania hirsuta]
MQLHYENTDIYAFLQELAEAFQSRDMKNIQYHIDIPPVINDAGRCRKAGAHGLQSPFNAFKFTPQGGKVGFYAALESDNQLRMAVSDSGLGIPQHFTGKDI